LEEEEEATDGSDASFEGVVLPSDFGALNPREASHQAKHPEDDGGNHQRPGRLYISCRQISSVINVVYYFCLNHVHLDILVVDLKAL